MAKVARTKNKDNARRAKKKISVLTQERVEYVDWKDVNLLRRFMSDRAKIRARRVTGNSAQQQSEVARAIKNAREMALLPYANRITQTRGQKRDRDGRRDVATDSPPVPTGPPPSPAGPAGADAEAEAPGQVAAEATPDVAAAEGALSAEAAGVDGADAETSTEET